MKSDYRVRAAKFLKDIFPYICNCLTDRYDVQEAVKCYNAYKHRNVLFNNGIARIALITSDYVIKWDYDKDYAYECGGCADEHKAFMKAKEMGYDYLLAESTLVEYHGYYFTIMPRIKYVGGKLHKGHDIEYYLTEDEFDWVVDFNKDIHSYTWGIRDGKACLIDYAMSDEVAGRW